MNLTETALLAAVTTLAGLVVVALWRGGGKLLAALVDIGRLPDVVTELVVELRNAITELRALARRVERLESYLPESVSLKADVTLSTEGNPA